MLKSPSSKLGKAVDSHFAVFAPSKGRSVTESIWSVMIFANCLEGMHPSPDQGQPVHSTFGWIVSAECVSWGHIIPFGAEGDKVAETMPDGRMT